MGRLTAEAKALTRRITRRLGYDLVPTGVGLDSLRSKLFAAHPNAVALDVGANTGQYAERLRDYGFAGQIHSYEPGQAAFTILSGRARHDPRWEPHQLALSDFEGTTELLLSANSVSSSLLEVAEAHVAADPRSRIVDREEVPVSTLDTQASSLLGTPLFLKLDVQGAEQKVIAGGEQTLSHCVGVQVELSFAPLYHDQANWLELSRTLQDRGFLLRYIEPGFESPAGLCLQAEGLFIRQGAEPEPAASVA